MHINVNSLPYLKRILNGDVAFAENIKKMLTSFAAMTHLTDATHAEGIKQQRRQQ
jgi:hypothetical protein